MLLVADSGSTHTQWMLADGVGERLFETQGLNPHFTSDGQFLDACEAVRRQSGLSSEAALRLFFYGAGCGAAEMQQRVRHLLSQAFPLAEIFVAGDLLCACQALCGFAAGRVGILGTGSNLCYYDGRTIARQRLSTGYVLGDEGSGNHVGRCLLKDYLEQRMPEALRCQFEAQHPGTPAQWLDRLYHQPNPNRMLASLAPFAAAHRGDAYIRQVLQHCFGAFLHQLDYYADLPASPLHLVGGVAAAFASEIREAASSSGIAIGRIVENPLPLLFQELKSKN